MDTVTNGDDVPLVLEGVREAWHDWFTGQCTWAEYAQRALRAIREAEEAEPGEPGNDPPEP